MQINTTHILSEIHSVPDKAKNNKDNISNRPLSFQFFINKNLLKCRFFSELSVLISSGVDIKKSFEIISYGITRQNDKQIINKMLNIIIKGSSLSTALEKSDFFSVYDYYSVRIGEEGGSLSSVLKELAAYYSRKIVQQRQIRSALAYPILVLFTSIFSLMFMLNYIVPMFEDVFLRFHGTLPSLTKSIIVLSDSFSKYAFYFLMVLSPRLFCISLIKRKPGTENSHLKYY